MSKTIDERVVSMQFDNKHFESNVKTSMNTLDKFKKSLRFDGATKGLESVNSAAKKVDMKGLGDGVETVKARFSALQVVGVTALANITNSAVNAGKRIVSALTIEPISDGFKEYELTLNAIQTTMAATGKTADEVKKELKKLDDYADRTVYSTADMINNLPKFTNAGVDLEVATKAMIGIANATALAGGGAREASSAFYNLGQSIGTGYLTRVDFNSISNVANITTMQWKEAMIEAAIAAGTLRKAGDDLYETGGKTFSLQQLFIDGLQHQWATSEVLLKVLGDYGDETTDIGKKAYDAAQNIKTYTQMMESLKATAGTGWKDTWELIFGDLDDAKVFWTGLTNFLSGIITKIADFRNKVVEVAMSNPLSNLAKKVKGISNTAKSALKPLKQYADLVDRIIRGEFGNQGDNGDKNYRKKRVEAEGYDYATAQTLVNEKLGSSVKLTKDLKIAQEEQGKTQVKNIDQLAEMSEKQLKSLGYTRDQIDAIKTLAEYAEDAGVPLSKFIENIDQMSGREMLIESFKNVGKGLATVFQSMKDAFLDIFPISAESIGLRIYSVLTRLFEFTKRFDISKDTETIDKLTRTFKGLFAALDIVTTIIGGPLKLVFKVVTQLLDAFDLDILSVTAAIGDAIVRFRDWLDSIFDFTGLFKKIAPHVKKAADAIRDWFEAVKPFEKVAAIFNKVTDAITNFAKSVWNADVTQNIVSGLVNGLKSGAKAIWDAAINLGKKIIEAVCDILGIESPSTEFFEIGKNIIAGLFNGLKSGVVAIGNVAKELCSKLISAFDKIDLSQISNVFYNIFRLFPQLKILNYASALLNIFKEMGGNIGDGLAGGLAGSVGKVWDAIVSMATKLIDAFTNVLGIASPSKVFFALGGFIIAGLIGGLMNGSGNVSDALKTVGQSIANFFSGIDFKMVLAAGTIVSSLLLIKKALTVAEGFTSAAKGIGKLTGSIGGLIETVNKGLMNKLGLAEKSKWETIPQAILKVAIALGILVAAVIAMSMVDTRKLWGAIGALAVIVVIMGALAGIIVGLMAATKLIATGANVNVIGNVLLKVAGAMLLMALVAKITSNIYPDDLYRGVGATIAFAGIIVGLMAATKLLSTGAPVDKIGGTLFKVAKTMLVMVLVAKMASKMSPADLIQGTLAIAAFGGIIVGLMAATKLLNSGVDVKSVGGTLFKVAAAILIMMMVAKMAAKMSPGDLIQGTLAIAAFGGIIVGLMAATKLLNGGRNVDKIGGALLKVGATMLLMVIVAKIAASMTPGELNQGITALALFGGIIVGLMAACKLLTRSTNIEKFGGAILKIGAAMLLMAIVAKIAASMTVGDLIKGTLAVAAFGGIAVALMYVTKLLGGAGDVGKLGKTLMTMAGAIAVLALSALALSFVDPSKLLVATAALTIIIGMFALVVREAGKLTSAIGPLIILTVAITLLSTALIWLAYLPVEQSLAAAASLSLVLIAMTAALFAISKISSITGTGMITGLLGLAAIVVLMGVVVHVLSTMSGMENAATNATVLGAFMLVLSVVLVITAATGAIYAATGGVAMLGLVGMLAIILCLYPIIGALALMEGMENAATNINALIKLMTALTAILVVLAIVGPLALIGVTAMYALTGFMLAIGALATAIGALIQKFPALQSFLDTGIPVLIQLAGGIGEMIGAFVGGIAEQLASSLPAIGLCLSQFMVNAMPFVTGIKMVDKSVLTGVGIMAGAVLALTAADLIAGVVSFLQGGSSFATLGTELSMFMMNAMPFIMASKAIDPSIMAGVKSLADAVLTLCGANMLETITGWLGGGSSLATFGSQLGQLGTDMNTFVTNLGTFTEDQVKTVDCAGKAIKALASAASEIPNDGGWLGAILGENSLASFSSKLPQLGTDLNGFITNLGTFTSDQVTTVDCAGKAIKALAEAASEIPNEGGWAAAICGDNSLATFGSKLPGLGTDLAGFITNLGTFGEDSITTVDCAGRAIKALAEAANAIPNEGGFWAKLAGDNSLATFGEKLPGIGTNLKAFITNLGTFNADSITTVNAACNAIRAITNLGKLDLGETATGLTKVGSKLGKFGGQLASFVSGLADVGAENITSAVNKTKELISLAQTAADANIESLSTFGTSLKKVATEGVKGFVTEYTKEDNKTKVIKAAETLINSFVKGVKDKKEDVIKVFQNVAEAASKQIATKDIKAAFTTAGKDLVTGFANGIKNNKSLATDAGSSLGKAALKAAKEALDENSPSKEMYEVGDFAGIGFVNALYDNVSNAGKAGKEMARSSIDGLKGAISRISDAINSDIDTQPTIRPVMDLSDVRSGANAIGSMFSGRRTLFIDTNTVGAVSASMAGYQNGNGSDDVVSAIKGLRKDINNMPRNTYTVNGVTYDDGSSISDAVATLVRAAKVERRI